MKPQFSNNYSNNDSTKLEIKIPFSWWSQNMKTKISEITIAIDIQLP